MADFNPLEEKIRKRLGILSHNDKRISDFFLKNRIPSALETVDALGKKIGVSKSAIVRFASRLGYDNFKVLQKDLQEHLYYRKMETPLDLFSKTQRLGQSKADILSLQFTKNIENIRATSENIRREDFNKVVDRLCSKTGRIFILGQRKSFGLALYFYALLNPVIDNVYLLEIKESFLTDSLLLINKGDFLIVLSFQRYAIISVEIAEYFASVGAKVALITDSYISPASKWANYVFICASEGVSIFDTAASAISVMEAIFCAVVTYKGKSVRKRLKTSEDLLKKFRILQLNS